MNSTGIHPPTHEPVAASVGRQGFQQTLRVRKEEDATRCAAPSIAMPLADTELSELLAHDDGLCMRRRTPPTAIRTNKAAGSSACDVEDKPQADLPAALSSHRGSGSLAQARMDDEELGQVIDAWPDLPRNVRAGVLALIRATNSDDA